MTAPRRRGGGGGGGQERRFEGPWYSVGGSAAAAAPPAKPRERERERGGKGRGRERGKKRSRGGRKREREKTRSTKSKKNEKPRPRRPRRQKKLDGKNLSSGRKESQSLSLPAAANSRPLSGRNPASHLDVCPFDPLGRETTSERAPQAFSSAEAKPSPASFLPFSISKISKCRGV